MKYSQGDIGRVFIVNFEHGDDFLEELRSFVEKENISFATITFLGAVSGGDVVTGPKKRTLPAEPNMVALGDVRETVGFGTIVNGRSGPEIHVHASFGKSGEALTGCLRKNCKIFITIEALITEVCNASVVRALDEKIGHKILNFSN
jgi:uncharacterized protein